MTTTVDDGNDGEEHISFSPAYRMKLIQKTEDERMNAEIETGTQSRLQ